MESPALETLLQTLATSGVELIVVGGLAAVAQGAPVAKDQLMLPILEETLRRR
jgi:hypothetical protein